MRYIFSWATLLAVFFSSCSLSKNVPVSKKLSPSELQEDFAIVKGVLFESHPSLDWFTPKEEITQHFEEQYNLLVDSMSTLDFKHFISKSLSTIRCAHTSCNFSRVHTNRNNQTTIQFPFIMRAIGDTLITSFVNDDSVNANFIRGVIIRSINHYPAEQIIEELKNYVQTDGFNQTGKISQLNTGYILPTYFHQLISKDSIWNVEFINRFGITETATFKLKRIPRDESRQRVSRDTSERSRSLMALNSTRNLQIDTTLSSAFMTLNTFKSGSQLRSFYKETFKTLHKNNIQYLVIDLRRNPGGLISNTNKLLRYVKKDPFYIVQENYAVSRKSSYKKYISNYSLNRLISLFSTKEKDGNYHLTFHERNLITPKKKYHFKGEVFVLTGGYSYSASAIFAKQLQGQSNVKIVGEETGGGAYGTTAMTIYRVTLPNSKIDVSIPLYKVIVDSTLMSEGRGVYPDISLPLTVNDFRSRIDPVIHYLRNYLTTRRMENGMY